MARTKAKAQKHVNKVRGGGKSITPVPGEKKKSHRWRPGTVSLREIRRYQKDGKLLVPKQPFSRLVREVLQEHEMAHGKGFRIEKKAMEALHEMAEQYVTKLTEIGQYVSARDKRKTLMPRDWDIAVCIERGAIPPRGQFRWNFNTGSQMEHRLNDRWKKVQ